MRQVKTVLLPVNTAPGNSHKQKPRRQGVSARAMRCSLEMIAGEGDIQAA